MWESILNFLQSTGVYRLFAGVWWKYLIMYAIVGVLVYLAIRKGYEPLLLLPIAIGMFLTNMPGANLFHPEMFIGAGEVDYLTVFRNGGLIDMM